MPDDDQRTLEWQEGLAWCCEFHGYVSPSDRWDYTEEGIAAQGRMREQREQQASSSNAETVAADDASKLPPRRDQPPPSGAARDE